MYFHETDPGSECRGVMHIVASFPGIEFGDTLPTSSKLIVVKYSE